MKLVLTSLLTVSLAVAASVEAYAQAVPTGAQQQQQQQAQPAESEELAEASRLSREVVRLFSVGNVDEALRPATRALALREKALGPDHELVADALTNVAAVLDAQKKSEQAAQLYERALSIYERRLGGDAAKTNDSRERLGWVYYWRRNFDKAEAVFRRLLDSREKVFGAQHRLSAEAVAALAAVYLATGDEKERDAAYTRLLDYRDGTDDELPPTVKKVFEFYVCTGPSRAQPGESQHVVYKRMTEPDKPRRGKGGIEGGVLSGKAVSNPPPSYPVAARRAGVQGVVVVRVTVDETGRVVEASAMCGPQLLRDAGVEAARGARFTPTLLDGKPVKVTGTISYHFRLER